MTEMNILLFGDQTSDFHPLLRKLLHKKGNPVLGSFLERANVALRDEITRQSSLTQEKMPQFTSISDLIERYQDSKTSNPAIESAIVCICQIACFISYFEVKSEPFNPSNTRILGSCTGLLAAVAVSSSRSLADLPFVGVEIIRIAFRIGLCVAATRDRLQPGSAGQGSWSAVITGTEKGSIREELKQFHEENKIPLLDQIYISAIGMQSLTLSGPPSTLEELAKSIPACKGAQPTRLPIHGPYHAAHLYDDQDIEDILDHGSGDALASYVPNLPLLSSFSGKQISLGNTVQVLKCIMKEILMQQLHWNYVIEGAISEIKTAFSSQCTVFSFGPTSAGRSLVAALKQASGLQVTLDDCSLHFSDNAYSGQPSGKLSESNIAIVGMAGRFPSAADHELFWELLEKGKDVHKEIPKDRFDAQAHYDPTGHQKNTSHTPYGCFIDEPGLFDPRFFSMSPREAAQTDPMHRLALLTAYEALEMSGYTPNRTPSTQLDRVGTFFGQTSDDWRDLNAAQNIDTYFIPGGVRAFAPGRINYYFKFSGPSFSVDTACSSSFAAIQLACTSLWAGDCDTALAGGLNVMTNPDIFCGLSRGQFLSKTGNCQTWDNDADGYCRGDGVGTVILKRLEDAEADKDNILGVIMASATNHSAEAVSITHPHAGAQELLYKKILASAGVDPHDVSYIEMHGTGTQAGDGTEMRSVTNVFAPSHRQRRPDQTLHLGAVKSNIGHGEAASGMSALIKVLLMMERNAIPPHCGIKKTINQTFPKDLKDRNVHIPFEKTPWLRKNGQKRRVFLNNFSAAGGNTGLLMEDAPLIIPAANSDPRSTHIVTISGRSQSSLRKNTARLIDFIDKNPSTAVPSLSYTTTARRIHHNYRVSVAASDLNKVKDSLMVSLEKDVVPVSPVKPRVAFVFTGQGSHYSALGKDLFEESCQFRADILQFDKISQGQGFPSFQPLIDGSVTDVQSLPPLVTQLGLTCIQMALAQLWISWGVVPTAVMGHSLGEYAALNVAGVLSVSDTIYLVGQRARRLQDKCAAGTHAMLAVKGSVTSIEPVVEGKNFEIACINGPNETVISGSDGEISLLSEDLSSRGLKNTKLRVPYAFHSSQVDPILDEFEEVAGGVNFNAPSIPVISPLLGEVIQGHGSVTPVYLRRHARETVNFLGGIEAGRAVFINKTIWVEIGPHPVCLGMITATLEASHVISAPSLRRSDNAWKVVANSLCTLHTAGLSINWNEYHRGFPAAQQLLRLPTYAFDLKNYWLQYTNNWTLTKGDLNVDVSVSESKPKLSTTTVQKIIEEDIRTTEATVIVQSDLSEPNLLAAIKGHLVNGTGLCPSSIYGDMALTVADYLYKQLRPDTEKVHMNVCKMEVEKPLIANQKGSQFLRVSGTADLIARRAGLCYYSVSADGKKISNHAKCFVTYEDAQSWLSDWERSAYLVKSRIGTMMKGVDDGTTEKLHRGMAYKLFSAIVQYDQKYRGMEEVILDSSQLEATSRVIFQTSEQDGNFFCSPYWIDSLAHLSGFIMNANDAVDSKSHVYISHGWDSMRFARSFSKDKTYRSYVKMQPAGGKMVAGDVYIFEENTIIGVVGGLKFQCIPRSLLNTFLPPAGTKQIEPVPVRHNVQKQVDTGKHKPKATNITSLPNKNLSTVTSQAMDIVAEEIGVPTSELSDNIVLVDLGVDSLLSLTISGRLREQLNLEVASSLFTDCPTIVDFKRFLSQQNSDDASMENPDSLGSGSDEPDLDSDFGSSDSEESGVGTPATEGEDEDVIDLIRATIAGEMGVAAEELDGSTDLTTLGMDSLMSLTILGSLREKMKQELSPAFLSDNSSIDAMEKKLSVKSKPTVPTNIKQKLQTPPSATSILLQGKPKTAAKTLFLFPDGSGSATSYASISTIAPDVAVYGLNCPYMKTPEDYTCGIDGIATLYLAEVRRRQPKGPYHLGGWSAGGVVAYEVALQLIRAGETIQRLILLDAPCPISLEPLPSRLHDFFNDIGLLGTPGGGSGGGVPSWLLPHFKSTIRALQAYEPARMDPDKAPKTFAVWATDGVCKEPGDPRPSPSQEEDPKSMRWLLENRTDFGANGWEGLLGERNIETARVGCNHFTMMRDPSVRELGDLIRRGLS